ncbi:amidohydrolase family protein [Legionella sp. PL877]|uniref:amidohydrolase family protein n=1 Tax=Legionella sp. PL877 TaxID=3046773 RepID=UPI0013EF723A
MISFFDSHFHIIDPRFPLLPNDNYLPSPFTCSDYFKHLRSFNLLGGAVVSGSFQGFDQQYLLASLQELGSHFVGVTQLPLSVTDDDILKLNAAGVRAVRFNLRRGGSEGVSNLKNFAQRIYDIAKWHVELYVDSSELTDLATVLLKLPAVSIDHLGLAKEGLPTLLSLVEHGVKVKASGFGRINFNPAKALKEIAAANPDALIFGTDLPSTRAPRPFHTQDLKLIIDTLDEKLVQKILYQNALTFYQPKTTPTLPT